MHQIRVSFDCSVHALLSISDYVEFIAINDLSLAEILLSNEKQETLTEEEYERLKKSVEWPDIIDDSIWDMSLDQDD